MTIITDEMKQEAVDTAEVADDILFWAEVALVNRGVSDADEMVPALLTAAWQHHKETHGAENAAPFAALLRRWADSTDAMERPN